MRLLDLLKARANGSVGPATASNAPAESVSDVEKLNTSVASDVPRFQPLQAGTDQAKEGYKGGTEAVQIESTSSPACPPAEPPKDTKKSNPSPKPNPATHSKLDDLPPEILAKIIHLLETKTFDAAILEVTAPEPYGLGINTSRSSLERLASRHNTAQLVRDEEESTSYAIDLTKNVSASDDQISRTTVRFLRHRLLKKSMSNKSSSAEILTLAKSLDRLQAADFAERRLRLAEARLKIGSEPKSDIVDANA
ncbi:MAG: hypothetical protein ACXWIU_13545 [Limisphaerales bacterium]